MAKKDKRSLVEWICTGETVRIRRNRDRKGGTA